MRHCGLGCVWYTHPDWGLCHRSPLFFKLPNAASCKSTQALACRQAQQARHALVSGAFVDLTLLSAQVQDVQLAKGVQHQGLVVHVRQFAGAARVEVQLALRVALNDQGAAGLEAV